MRYVVAVLLAVLLAGLGCYLWPEVRYYRAASRFDSADAAQDAARAWDSGDRRLMAAYGNGMVTPGIPEHARWFYQDKFGVNAIDDTSDCLTSGGMARYDRAAKDYARRYNQALLPRIQGTPTPQAIDLSNASSAVAGETVILSGNVAALTLPLRPLKDPALKKAVLAAGPFEFFQIKGDQFTKDEHLALASDLKGVTSLILADTAITSAGLDQILVHQQVDTLFLSRTAVDDAGIAKLKPLRNLRVLYLTGSKVTDRGLAHLEPFEKLEMIYLPEEGITDAGMIHLARLKSLKELILSPAITDDGLAQLRGLKSLRIVSVRSTKVTDQAIRDFQRAIPGVSVSR